MKRRAALVAALMFLLLTVASSNVLAALNDPYDSAISYNELTRTVRTYFEMERFAELEDMAREFRTKKSCLPTGWPKLDGFYNAFSCGNLDSEQAYEKTFMLLDKWSKEFPGSVTERVAEANVWTSYAWFARGGGYADTVSDDGWRLYDARIQKAYELLSQRPDSTADDCPHRYALLLKIGMAQSWDRARYEKLFDEAIAIDSAYYPCYINKAIYLLPRWSGEEGDWQRFAEEAVKLTPKSEGMSAYTRIAWDVHAYGDGVWKNFEEGGVSWPMMKQGFLDIERNHPGSDYNLNYFAFFAVLANDRQTARVLFERIGNKPNMKVWKSGGYYEQYRRIAYSNEEFCPPSIHDGEKKRLECMRNSVYLWKTIFCAEPPVGLLASIIFYFYAFVP